jgi:RES domain-containing protein
MESTPRDLALLDLIDAFSREAFTTEVWRICRDGRDPIQGAASRSRWCNGDFDVLYTSFERDGALAEIHALLTLQPVFPSKVVSRVHRLSISVTRTLRLADLLTLERLGVDTSHYGTRDYTKTQAIADAAYFLDFDGIIAPSARWPCLNAMLFTERLADKAILIQHTESDPVDWATWQRARRP